MRAAAMWATHSVWRRRVALPAVTGAALGSLFVTFVGQFAALITGVLSARILGPEDRGNFALITLVPSVISGIVPLGSIGAIAYFVARDKSHSRNIVNMMRIPVMVIILIIALLQCIALVMLLTEQPRDLQFAGLISLSLGPSIIGYKYGLSALQGMELFRLYNILRLLPALLYVVALGVVYAFGQDNVIGTVAALSIANFISAVYVLFVMGRNLPSVCNQTELGIERSEIVRYGAKGFLGTASPLETLRIDQFMIGLFISPIALGFYTTSLAYTSLPRVISQSLATIALPRIAAQRDPHRASQVMWKFFAVTMILSLLFALLIVMMAGLLIPLLFGADFEDAVFPAQILIASSILFGGRRILGESLRGMGEPGISAIAELVSWVSLLVAAALFAPRWGLTGVALAVVLASISSFLVVLHGAWRRSVEVGGEHD